MEPEGEAIDAESPDKGSSVGSTPDRPEPIPTTTHVQHRALNAIEHAVAVRSAADLLSTTGPLAELTSAERRAVLTEARRLLIAKKGSGVVFEAMATSRVQHAAARFGIFGLKASLSEQSNDSRVDLLIAWRQDDAVEIEVGYQLKTGGDRYIRASVNAVEEGILVLVPSDVDEATAGRAVRAIEVGELSIQAPTRKEILDRSTETLKRLETGTAPVDLGRVARQALRDALTDALAAAAFDLVAQVIQDPDKQIDWPRAARALAKTGVSSALGSLLATTSACSSARVGKRVIDAAGVYRATRMAGTVLPRAVDVAFDVYAYRKGTISVRELGRRTARNTGAVAAELLLFRFIARLAGRLGPVGQAIVMVGGGILAAKLGELAGESFFSLFEDLLEQPEPLPEAGHEPRHRSESLVSALLGSPQMQAIATTMVKEHRRLERRASSGTCIERSCTRKHHARGMCSMHYQRWWREVRRAGRRTPSRRARHRRPAAISVQRAPT
jgi:hypothetical protein